MGCRHRLRTRRRRDRVTSPRFFRIDGISRSRTLFVRWYFIYHHPPFFFNINENTNSHLPFTSLHRPQLAARRKTPQFPNHHPRFTPVPTAHRALRDQPRRRHPVYSNLLRPRQIMARRRSRKLQHQSVQHTHWGPG